MNPKTRKIAKVIALIVALAMIITSFSFVMLIPGLFGSNTTFVYAGTEDYYLDQKLSFLKEYLQYLKESYKDEVTYDQLVKGALEGATDSLGDPYSEYFGDEAEGQKFVESVKGEYSGIGLNLEYFNSKCRVVTPIPRTPAEKSGIKTGDIITKIDGKDITTKTLDEAVEMMRGEAGTKVTLTIDRNGQVLNFTLIREKIKTVSVYSKMLENKIGYIQLTTFDADSDDELKAELEALEKQGMKSLIFDIRNNPGGLINTAVNIAQLLMPQGPVAYFEHQGKIEATFSTEKSATLKVPIVLLVNEGSASASEILAGALQDTRTATLVGTTTFGKGVSQYYFDLVDGTSAKISTDYFLTPNKNKINQIGITPDYIVQDSINEDEKELTEEYLGFAPMIEKVKPKAGMTGLNVFGAQQRLAMLGYAVKATGTMDDATVAAVKKFQKENKLYSSGTLDYTTMSSIDKAVVEYITGSKAGEDLQLNKAIELLE